MYCAVRKCDGCGCEIPEQQSNGGRPRRWCSQACRDKSRPRRRGNPKPHTPAPKILRVCEFCGNEFIGRQGKVPKFCGGECRNRSYNKNMAPRQCLECGVTFTPVFDKCVCCSNNCNDKYRYENPTREPKACRHCHEWFVPKYRRQTLCSKLCNARDRAVKANRSRGFADGWLAVLQWRSSGRECDQCGKWFSGKHSKAKRCSDACARMAYNEKARLCAIRRLSQSHGGRGKGEWRWSAVSRLEVFERDGWTCYICGGQCLREWSDGRKEPLAPALDHVVPVSKGGSHAMDNVRCIHRICNAAKKDRSEDETKRGVALAVWLAGVTVVDMYQ